MRPLISKELAPDLEINSQKDADLLMSVRPLVLSLLQAHPNITDLIVLNQNPQFIDAAAERMTQHPIMMGIRTLNFPQEKVVAALKIGMHQVSVADTYGYSEAEEDTPLPPVLDPTR